MKYIIKFAIILSTFFNIAESQLESIPLKEREIVEKVSKILSFSHSANQNEVWPNYDLTKTPLIITFENNHVFVFNHASSDPAFEPLNIEGLNPIFSSTDKWELSQSAFNPNFLFEGKSAYVFNLDQALKDLQRPLHVLVHERFHQFEFDRINPPTLLGPYQGHLNSENLALAKLEEMILIDVMQAQQGSLDQMESIRDFIALNGMRRLLLNSASIAWEDHQQVMEGMADYVGYKMLEQLHLVPGFDSYKELANALKREVKGNDYSDHAIKWRHYTIGASIGYILDILKVPHWKHKINKGGISLQEIVNKFVYLSPHEMEDRFEKVKMTYGWSQIFDTISKEIHKFESEIEALINAYDKSNGVVISIGNPGTGMSGSGSNERMLYLPDGSTLSINDNLEAISEDNLWKLNTIKIPYLFKRGTGEIEFKIDPEAEISIDGEKYILKDWISKPHKQSFQELTIKGTHIDFVSKIFGRLSVDKVGNFSIFYD